MATSKTLKQKLHSSWPPNNKMPGGPGSLSPCCVCMYVCLSVGRSVGLSVCPSVRLSVCPSVRLSVRPSVRTYVLYCIVMYCNVLQCNVMQCNVMQCNFNVM